MAIKITKDSKWLSTKLTNSEESGCLINSCMVSRNSYKGNKELEKVEIPNGITTIGEGAFEDCPALTTVVIPESVKANGITYKVTRIRKGFLKNCKQATKVDIGKNINTIDKNAFNYGKRVQKVVIRGKLKKVGKYAFKNTKKNVIIKMKANAKNFEKNKKLLEKSGLPNNATVKRVKNKK